MDLESPNKDEFSERLEGDQDSSASPCTSGTDSAFLPPTSRELLPFKAWYFTYFAAHASIEPFLPVYYRRAGVKEGLVGLLMALRPIMSTLTNPLWGMIVDFTGQPISVLLVSLTLAMAWRLLLGLEGSFWLFFVTAALAHGCASPCTSIVDVSTMQALPDKAEYGKQRLWGAVSWGVVSVLAGLLITYTTIYSAFFLHAVLMSTCIAVSNQLPREGPASSCPKKQEGKGAVTAGDMAARLRPLLKDMRVVSFFAITVIMGYSMGSIEALLFLYLEELGGSATLMGLTLTVTCVAEVPAMYYSGLAIRAFGVAGVLCADVEPLLLHGITFGWAFTAGTTHAGSLAPAGLEATIQGVFNACMMGVGGSLAKLCGGVIYGVFGARALFWSSACIAFAGLLLFAASNFYAEGQKVAHYEPLQGQELLDKSGNTVESVQGPAVEKPSAVVSMTSTLQAPDI
eukprot:jgi/Mesen1/8666/ME000504S08109